MTGDDDSVAIIGGGALGLAAAYRLARAGVQVVVFESGDQLGGLAAGFRPGSDADATLEKFYHHVFKTDRTLIRYAEELGLGGRLEWSVPVSSLLREGRVFPMSLRGVLGFSAIPLFDRLRFGATIAALKLVPNERLFRGTTAVRWSRRWAGERAFRGFIEPQLVGKFGARAPDIAMSWLWSRFHERTLSLGYVRGGFQQLYDALGARIRANGGRIELGATVERVRRTGDAVEVDVNGVLRRFRQVLVTTPSHVFRRIAEGLPNGYAERYPEPEYFHAHVLIVALERKLTDQYWISIGDAGFPFLVLVEHTNLVPAGDYGGRHLLYLGNYLPGDDPLLSMSQDEVLTRFTPAIQRLAPQFDPAAVRDTWMFKAPYAQPIVTAGYGGRLPPVKTPIPGVFAASMAHVYPQDRGQNYSLALGERVAEAMLKAQIPRSSGL